MEADAGTQCVGLGNETMLFAKRYDALDRDGQVVVGNAIIQEERRIRALVKRAE